MIRRPGFAMLIVALLAATTPALGANGDILARERFVPTATYGVEHRRNSPKVAHLPFAQQRQIIHRQRLLNATAESARRPPPAAQARYRVLSLGGNTDRSPVAA